VAGRKANHLHALRIRTQFASNHNLIFALP
jgi:hypothetical protein